ncbi:hypothetical protein ACF064_01550 [Streptomyces sp. NPDC015492]|uniref:hypothetical protein n=1 Tax=Streptomyces sp. NPDC015492 TaxID=3364958 RepID=UPI0036F56F4F
MPALVLEADREVWERQPAESESQFERFELFREMGAKRSPSLLAKKLEMSTAYVSNLARIGRWRERAAAWDREQARQDRARLADAEREHAAAGIAASRMIYEHVMETLVEMRDRGDRFKPGQVSRLLEVASKVGWDALRAGASEVHLSGPGGGPVQVAAAAVGALGEEEAARLELELAQEIVRRHGGEASGDH